MIEPSDNNELSYTCHDASYGRYKTTSKYGAICCQPLTLSNRIASHFHFRFLFKSFLRLCHRYRDAITSFRLWGPDQASPSSSAISLHSMPTLIRPLLHVKEHVSSAAANDDQQLKTMIIQPLMEVSSCLSTAMAMTRSAK